MPLIARIPASHTIQQFRKAARQRFAEATRCAVAGDRLIGIYLCGYAAEMILKAAYFRLAGKEPFDPITLPDLYEARAHAITDLGIAWGGKNLHDLPRWAELLIEERRRQAVPYPEEFAGDLGIRVAQIYQNWREHIRYHGNRPRPGELAETFEAVTWLVSNFGEL